MKSNVKLLSKDNHTKPPNIDDSWSAVVSHTHMLRSAKSSFEEAKDRLLEWVKIHNISAIGIGSPWEPVSAKRYKIHETTKRNAYSSGQISPESVMDRKPIEALFEEINRRAEGRTLFFQDNETPKGRNGHNWYFGYKYMYPAWHDYSQDKPVQYYDEDPNIEINPLTGTPHRRRPSIEVIAEQRRAGALAVWAHPTSWWRDPDGSFVTNIAAEMPLNLMADGYLDGIVTQGYDAWHPWYQEIWFQMLSLGAVVPGFAEMDACFDSQKLAPNEQLFVSKMRINGTPSLQAIIDTASKGEAFVSNGAHLTISIDSHKMGDTLRTRSGNKHTITLEAYPVPGQKTLSLIQIIGKNGAVLAEEKDFPGGTLSYNLVCGSTPDYILARTFGETDSPFQGPHQNTNFCAVTNPIYLHEQGYSFNQVITECVLHFGSASQWIGGSVAFETASGDMIEKFSVKNSELRTTLPANAVVKLAGTSGEKRSFFIAAENTRAQKLVSYLSAGEFLNDYPNLQPGEVPAEAFRLKEMQEALRFFKKKL